MSVRANCPFVGLRAASLLIASLLFSCFITTSAFHLSFGHRLPLKSVNSPQLNPDSHLIRPVECRNANNQSEAGICMFSIDCMQNKGVPLSICKHKYFVGTCCRLPDYNNFVGIVYDLRDTETNHVLEAREVTGSSSPAPAPAAAQDLATPQASSSSTPKTAATVEVASSEDSSRSSTRPATGESADGIDMAKYRISSTSLFGSSLGSSSVAATTPATKTGESARNSDGSAEPIRPSIAEPHPDSLQLISSNSSRTVENKSAEQQKQEQKILEILDLEVLSTMKSVHSAPSTLSSMKPPSASSNQPLKSSIYALSYPQSHVQLTEVYEMSSVPTTSAIPSATATAATTTTSTTTAAPTTTTATAATALKPTSELEFAGELASRGPAIPASSTTSDQEFTLSADVDKPTSSDKPATVDRDQSQSATSQQASSGSDLVSSTAGQPATTPFTVSLSTALLPNMSTFAPTQPPPPPTTTTALVSSSHQTQSQSQSTSHAAAAGSPTVATSSTASHELANFSQLYSNQHSSPASSDPPPPATMHSSNHNNNNFAGNRPSLHSTLQAASKIVTGSSSSNNLIPGLSNLQSAILSHIPFKIASGLSSYLQAAMKPSGASASKPLISSNTAPHLQYQQQQQQQQQQMMMMANSSRPTPALANPTSPTTISQPALSQSSTPAVPMAAPSVGGGVRFPVGNDLESTVFGSTAVSFPKSPAPSIAPAIMTAASDVVRESQRVCGRPQLQHPHHVQSPTSGEAGVVNKRMARIVGGNQSAFGQWPWMVSLRQWRKGAFLHKCGAALLNENWAITAAHCVEDVKVTDLLLRLGEFDVSNQEEPYPFVERRVKTVKSHPLFNPKTFEYDLALLRFAEPIKYERNIIPVCVPSGNDTYIDRMATVIGWGRLYEDGPLPDVIQHVDVPIITNNECEKMYKNAGYIEEIPDMFICAGISKGGRDSCEGDSGGPLTMVDHDGRSYLVGIISWGIGCALPSQPGVYTRITAFSGWINELAGS